MAYGPLDGSAAAPMLLPPPAALRAAPGLGAGLAASPPASLLGVEALSAMIAAALAGRDVAPPGLEPKVDANEALYAQPAVLATGGDRGGPSPRTEAKLPARWWTTAVGCACPISGFPIAMLPYPPFRLRTNPKCASPHRFVDGKHLALQVIVTGVFEACGRPLDRSDVEALDDHIAKCKLGAYRPGRALLLARAAMSLEVSPEERAGSHRALARYVAGARAELQRLCRIQNNRVSQFAGDRVRAPARLSPQSTPLASSPFPPGASQHMRLSTSAEARRFCRTVSMASLSSDVERAPIGVTSAR